MLVLEGVRVCDTIRCWEMPGEKGGGGGSLGYTAVKSNPSILPQFIPLYLFCSFSFPQAFCIDVSKEMDSAMSVGAFGNYRYV